MHNYEKANSSKSLFQLHFVSSRIYWVCFDWVASCSFWLGESEVGLTFWFSSLPLAACLPHKTGGILTELLLARQDLPDLNFTFNYFLLLWMKLESCEFHFKVWLDSESNSSLPLRRLLPLGYYCNELRHEITGSSYVIIMLDYTQS